VRAAAIQSAGMLMSIPSMRACDATFPMTVAQTLIGAMDDGQTAVRARAAIAIGDLARHRNAVPVEARIAMLNACVAHCDDHAKVAASAARAVGYIAGWLADDYDSSLLMQRAASALADKVSDKNPNKVRWNACHSLGMLLQQRFCFLGSSARPSQTVGDVLLSAACFSDNYKVRIAAAGALEAPRARSDYPDAIVDIVLKLSRVAIGPAKGSGDDEARMRQKSCSALARIVALCPEDEARSLCDAVAREHDREAFLRAVSDAASGSACDDDGGKAALSNLEVVKMLFEE